MTGTGGQRPPAQQPQQVLHRFHIGNLPDHVTKEDITKLITTSSTTQKGGGGGREKDDAIVVVSVESIGKSKKGGGSNNKNKAFAIVAITNRLPNWSPYLQFQGVALTVQPAGRGFGSSAWTKPHHTNTTNDNINKPRSARISNEAAKEKARTTEGREQPDDPSSTTDADGLVAARTSSPPPKKNDETTNNGVADDDEDDKMFSVVVTQQTEESSSSLNALLADYGDYDPNWQTMRIVVNDDTDYADAEVEVAEEPPTTTMPKPQPAMMTTTTHNFLGQMGKAPIHINISTFGRVHGVPKEFRHTAEADDDIMSYDCLDYDDILVPCPPYLDFLDGQAGNVKRAMINAAVRSLARQEIANAIMARLQQPPPDDTITAPTTYGYHNPHVLTIYIGSDTGRHRSVILAELTAMAVRQYLRKGNPRTLHCPVSVGCTHRDIKKKRTSSTEKTRQKVAEDEDEKEIKARRLPQRAVRW
jgi:hypothetical protein